MSWRVSEVQQALSGAQSQEVESTSFLFQTEQTFDKFILDSRADLRGQFFVPIVGERFDAHQFVAQALAQGAVGTFWSQSGELPSDIAPHKVVRCQDTTEALQQVARYHLQHHCQCKVVGVTGSTGKTLTKDLIGALLATRWKVAKTPGNYNNDIGLPLTVLGLEPDHQIVVLEMGMRGPGQIRRLAQLVSPEVGVITNIGVSHIELLGSRQAIAAAKGELLECLSENGLAILPHRCDLLSQLRESAGPRRVQTFSCYPEDAAEARPSNLHNLGLAGWKLDLPNGRPCHLPIPGPHLLEDFMAAWLVAQHFGIDDDKVQQTLLDNQWSKGRLEQHQLTDGTVVLNDAYNAAPDSMRGALEVLSFATGRKLAVLGDMLELGEHEKLYHQQVGQWVGEFSVDQLLAVGPKSKWLAETAQSHGVRLVEWVATTEEALQLLPSLKQPGDTVLLKASRGMGLDRLLAAFSSLSSAPTKVEVQS